MKFNSRFVFTSICFLFSNAAWAGNNKSSSPVSFLQNIGQWQQEILYKGTSSTPVSFLKDGISFAHSGKEIKRGGVHNLIRVFANQFQLLNNYWNQPQSGQISIF